MLMNSEAVQGENQKCRATQANKSVRQEVKLKSREKQTIHDTARQNSENSGQHLKCNGKGWNKGRQSTMLNCQRMRGTYRTGKPTQGNQKKQEKNK